MKLFTVIAIVLPCVSYSFIPSTPRAAKQRLLHHHNGLAMRKIEDEEKRLFTDNFFHFGTIVVTATLAFGSVFPANAVETSRSPTTPQVTSSTLAVAAEVKVMDMALPSYGSLSDPNAGQDSIEFSKVGTSSTNVQVEPPPVEKTTTSKPTMTQSKDNVMKEEKKPQKKQEKEEEQKPQKIDEQKNSEPAERVKKETVEELNAKPEPIKEEVDVAAAYKKAYQKRGTTLSKDSKETADKSENGGFSVSPRAEKKSSRKEEKQTKVQEEKGKSTVGNADVVDLSLPSYGDSTKTKSRSVFAL